MNIPDTIGGYPVTTIEESAFKGNTPLTDITFGEHVQTINAGAFSEMSALEHLELPNSAQTIGSDMLYGSDTIDKLVLSSELEHELKYYFGNNTNFIPDSLNTIKYADGAETIEKTLTQNTMGGVTLELAEDWTTIADSQLKDSEYLVSIQIPSGVTEIGASAFEMGYYADSALTTVTFQEGSQLDSIGRSAFSGTSKLTSIEIPSSVTSIGIFAFNGASALTNVTFEADSQLESIGDFAFQDASSLYKIKIPTSVTNIGRYSFRRASALTSIEIPASVTEIDTGTFKDTYNLTTIFTEQGERPTGWSSDWNLDDRSVVWGYEETMDDGTLQYATTSNNTVSILGLSDSANPGTDLIIPNEIDGKKVNQIVNQAFESEENLKSVQIPNTVIEIQKDTFKSASNLEIVTFEDYSQLESIGEDAFRDSSSLISIGIPSSVTSIGPYAFRDASALTSVTFEQGSQLESIGGYAFSGASNLTSIRIPASVTSIGSNAFHASAWTIYVETSEKPSGWYTGVYSGWNSSNRPVHWGIQTYDSTPDNTQYALLNDDTIKIAGLTSDNTSEDITIPSDIDGYTVTEIQSYAIMNHDYLNSVYIPDTITVIGRNAFENYTGTINVQAESKPENWDDNWNHENTTVNWGYIPE